MRTLVVPLQLNGRGGFSSTSNPADILYQQIVDLLVTNRFERVFLPNHGANLREFLFAPIDPAILQLKANDIRNVLEANISFGSIVDVRLSEVADAMATVRVEVKFKVIESSPEVLVVTKVFSGLVDEESIL